MKKEVLAGWRIIFSITGAREGSAGALTALASAVLSDMIGGGVLLLSSAVALDWTTKFSSEVARNIF